jgi:predicted CopG family antitoxin
MRELTITLPDDVYDELERRVGPKDISVYIEHLVRPHIAPNEALEADYRAMAADEEREREAREWIEAAPDDALP